MTIVKFKKHFALGDPVLAVIKLNIEVEAYWTLLPTPSNIRLIKRRKNEKILGTSDLFSFFKTNMSQKNGTNFQLPSWRGCMIRALKFGLYSWEFVENFFSVTIQFVNCNNKQEARKWHKISTSLVGNCSHGHDDCHYIAMTHSVSKSTKLFTN